MGTLLPVLIDYAIPQPFVYLTLFGALVIRWRVYSKLESGFDD